MLSTNVLLNNNVSRNRKKQILSIDIDKEIRNLGSDKSYSCVVYLLVILKFCRTALNGERILNLSLLVLQLFKVHSLFSCFGLLCKKLP